MLVTLSRGFSAVMVLWLIASSASCDKKSPTAPDEPCEYQISPVGTIGAAGGTGTLTISTGAACEWHVVSSVAWVTIAPPASGAGDGSVTYVVAENRGQTRREGTVVVAGHTVTFSQEGQPACTFDVNPDVATFGASGGNLQVSVTTGPDCAWGAASDSSWVRALVPSSGRGPGTVQYAVDANPSESARDAVLSIESAQVRLTQAGFQAPPVPDPAACDYSVSPTEIVLHWHHTGGRAEIVAPDGCAWSAGTRNEWVVLDSPAAGTGPAPIQFSNGAFTVDGVRRTPIEVRWPTPTAGQNVWITQEGCRWAITERERLFGQAGGQATVFVFGDPISTSCTIGCPWTAVADVPWIQIVSSMPRAGDDLVSYRVQPNTTGQERIGHIRVEDLTLTIRQFPQ